MPRLFCFCAALAILSVACSQAALSADELTRLPHLSGNWMNSAPLSLEQLEGKGIVVWYFEEQCPRCEGKWPELLATAAKHRDKPVVFIAVNSGNPPQQIASYLQRNQIRWPVIIDPDRSFEKESLGRVISLQNIYALRVRTGNGEWIGVNTGQFEKAIAQAATGASWRADPSEIPEELQSTWKKVELGYFVSARKALMSASKSSTAETQAAAKKLLAVVQQSMDESLAAIDEQVAAGEIWTAYQTLDRFSRQFKGYSIPDKVAQQYQELRNSDEVKNEKMAKKRLLAAIRIGSKGSPAAEKRAVKMLKQLLEKYHGTNAAEKAQAMLDQVVANHGKER